MSDKTDAVTPPRCMVEVLHRMEYGSTTKADADFMRDALQRAGTTIDTLHQQVHALIQRLGYRGRLQ